MGVIEMKSRVKSNGFEEEFTEEKIQEKLDNDEIDSIEAGFMIGYYGE